MVCHAVNLPRAAAGCHLNSHLVSKCLPEWQHPLVCGSLLLMVACQALLNILLLAHCARNKKKRVENVINRNCCFSHSPEHTLANSQRHTHTAADCMRYAKRFWSQSQPEWDPVAVHHKCLPPELISQMEPKQTEIFLFQNHALMSLLDYPKV